MELFPAVLIGGPPHSGKSVLAYSLQKALRAQNIDHYLLRAYPDGEGNWSNESLPLLAKQLRRKGEGSPAWVNAICQDLDHRQLPLLVDVGGKPTPHQEKIFGRCTHAILLTPNATALDQWRTYAQKYSLTILAELTSTLNGKNIVSENTPLLRAEITNLHRHSTAAGESFNALLAKLIPLLHYPQNELRQIHLNAAPTDTVIDLNKLANTLNINHRWQPTNLPLLLNYLPAQKPLAIYGGNANWLYAALAHHSYPASFYQFDPRLGWISPPNLQIGSVPSDAPLQVQCLQKTDHQHLKFSILGGYLNFSTAKNLYIPPPSPEQGIIIDGKLPHWLTGALTRKYAHAPWIAVYQPQLNGSVIIATHGHTPTLGSVIKTT